MDGSLYFHGLSMQLETVCYPLKGTFAVIKSLKQKLKEAYVINRSSFEAG
jgi:hypothetical protein